MTTSFRADPNTVMGVASGTLVPSSGGEGCLEGFAQKGIAPRVEAPRLRLHPARLVVQHRGIKDRRSIGYEPLQGRAQVRMGREYWAAGMCVASGATTSMNSRNCRSSSPCKAK